MNQTEILIVILLAITTLSVITLLSLIIFCIIPMKRRMIEISQMMYVMFRKESKYDNSHDSIRNALSIINNNIDSLSSSIDNVFDQIVKKSNKTPNRLPTPSVSKEIRETILENINMEVMLSKGMRIPNRESIIHIAEVAIKTYPDIDPTYIVKMTVSMVENFILNMNEAQNAKNKKLK